MDKKYVEWNQILNDVGKATLLPLHLFRESKYDFSNVLLDSSETDNPFLHDEALFPLISRVAAKAVLLSDPAFSEIYYGIIHITPDFACVMGPCCYFPVTDSIRKQYISMHRMTDFSNYQIPCVSINRAHNVMAVLLRAFQFSDITVQNHTTSPEKSTGRKIDEHILQKYVLSRSEDQFQHHSYRMEQLVYDCVRQGDEERLMRLLVEFPLESIGTMSRSAKKQSEYLAVLCISMAARAAIEGGVSPNLAYSINDLYLQQISAAMTHAQYLNIAYAAFHHLVSSVKKANESPRLSPHIEKTKQYINEHLNYNFSLNELSNQIHVSPSHLSRLFKQYEHMTITEYALIQRISAAKNMLRFSDYSVSWIATYLCFSSHSHFTAAFRKHTGETPSEYRQRHILFESQNED